LPLTEIRITYYLGPLDNPSHLSPDAVGPFIGPCQQESVIEETSLSLFLTAVRAIIERRDSKGGLQEVPKGDN
jgi:hypothetical protein